MMKVTIADSLREGVADFRGRAWLPAQILDWWDNRTERLLLLTGGPGTGKSMVAAWLAGYGPEPVDLTAQAELGRLRNLVKGAHFCNHVDTWNNSPKGLADNLARQLTANLPGFSEALLAQVGSILSLTNDQQVVNNYGSVTGVVVENLDLGGLLDEPSFLMALLTPLVEFFNELTREPLLLVIDGLDGAALYEGRYKIPRAILALVNLQAPVRVIATVRDADTLPDGFGSAYRRDLILNAPASQDDVADYVRSRMEGAQNAALAALAPEVIRRAHGNFLYASLVVSDLLASAKVGQQLTVDDVPDGLAGHYRRFLSDLTNDDLQLWRQELRPVLGTVAVSQDPNLRLKPLALVTRRSRQELLDTLQQCRSYLSGRFDQQDVDQNGPFTLFHKSFADFLFSSTDSQNFYIDPATVHSGLAYHYWPADVSSPGYQEWDDYGLRNMPTHLSGATQTIDEDDRHNLTGRLVNLVVNPGYQRDLAERIKDLSQNELSLERALQTACQDLKPEALALVIRSAFKLYTFRESTRRSRHVFQHAARGDLAAARMKLALFPVDADWRAAAELLIAWLVAATNQADLAAAQHLYTEVTANYSGNFPLQVLAARTVESWGGPPAQLLDLPDAPPPELLEAVVYRLQSEKIQSGLLVSYIVHAANQVYETTPILEEPMPLQGSDEAPVERARVDGPVLVAYIKDHSSTTEGCRAFLHYVSIMAANQYRQYRNLSLWKLLDAALRHPDPNWTRAALVRVVSAALAPGGAPFTEAFGDALRGHKARLDYQPAVDGLEEQHAQATSRASMLSEERGRNDVTGAHKRRFAALALAYSLLPGGEQRARHLLVQSFQLPRGYAGFMAPAWLNLAETLRIVALEPGLIPAALDEALEAARHVQDPVFRARTILFVNTLREHWWGLPAAAIKPAAADLPGVVRDFAAHPFAKRFAPFYRVGSSFNLPSPSEEAKDLPDELINARTLRKIAAELGYNPQALREINDGSGWDLDIDLAPGTSEVRLPDPDFAPWLAAHLSAEVAASASFTPRQKQELIQLLVPVAMPNRTTLDTVLARLIYAARPESLEILRACEQDLDELQPGDRNLAVSKEPDPQSPGPVTGARVGHF
ncbi:MAG: hypothetical protein WBO55_06875 [Rhizobiaceae bacterium]